MATDRTSRAERAERAERVIALQDLWSSLAMRHVALGSACACGAGGVSLRLDDFELDIVDYLEDQGQRSGLPAVQAFFAERARQALDGRPMFKPMGKPMAGPATDRPAMNPASDRPLAGLLGDLQQDHQAPEVSDWLLPRLERTLRSFAEQHGGAGASDDGLDVRP